MLFAVTPEDLYAKNGGSLFFQTLCTYAETGAVSDTSFLPMSSSTDSHCWFGEMTMGCGPSVMLPLPNTL